MDWPALLGSAEDSVTPRFTQRPRKGHQCLKGRAPWKGCTLGKGQRTNRLPDRLTRGSSPLGLFPRILIRCLLSGSGCIWFPRRPASGRPDHPVRVLQPPSSPGSHGLPEAWGWERPWSAGEPPNQTLTTPRWGQQTLALSHLPGLTPTLKS